MEDTVSSGVIRFAGAGGNSESNSSKYSCNECGKQYNDSCLYEEHKNQYSFKHKYCESCDKVEDVDSNHECEETTLKSSPTKENEMKVTGLVQKKSEKSKIEDGSSEKMTKVSVLKCVKRSCSHKQLCTSRRDKKKSKNCRRDSSKQKATKIKYPEQSIYKCQVCLQLFSKHISLTKHVKALHNGGGQFKCDVCDEEFLTEESFEGHRSLHGPEDKVICRGCWKTFSSLEEYYVHAKQNPGLHSFICKLCLRRFPKELLLDQHVCICQNGKPMHCACGKEFTKYLDVVRHSRGTKPFKCCTCPHLAYSLTAYLRHMRKHSKQKPFQCSKCHMKFAVIDFLNIHYKKFHSEMEKESVGEEQDKGEQHKCSSCEEVFPGAEELRKHREERHEQKGGEEDERVQCVDCGKLLKKNRLENHRNTHKTSASLCPHCGKLFQTRFKLTQHIITAHSNEPVTCDICMKVLKTKKILNEHMKTHLKSELGGRVPQAICPMCGLGLAQKGSLARHILLTHEKHKIVPNDKTYTCGECSEVLPNRAKYYSHRRMHRAMVERFPCEICGREFNKRQNLKRHLHLLHDETRVLGEPIFKCQFCTRCFREKKNLKRHYKMVHKVDDIM